MDSFIFFTDNVITVRPFQAEDAPEIHAAISESQNETSFWLVDLKGFSLSDVQDYIGSQPETWNEDQAYNFVILESSTNRILGGCGLNQINQDAIEAATYIFGSAQAQPGMDLPLGQWFWWRALRLIHSGCSARKWSSTLKILAACELQKRQAPSVKDTCAAGSFTTENQETASYSH